MEDFKTCTIDYFPENILIDILSYLSVRDLIRSGRVCKRWRRLVKDQILWRAVDLTAWERMTSRMLWALLRQYLGCGLRSLRLRGRGLQHQSSRGVAFLSRSWLKALTTRCPHLHKLSLLHADLRHLPSCRALPPTLQVLELHGCELPHGSYFFTGRSEDLSSEDPEEQEQRRGETAIGSASTLGIAIETMVLDNMASFTDQHLQSLASWQKLSRLELWDVLRLTAAGVRASAARDAGSGVQGLSRVKYLELVDSGQPESQMQMASLGLGGLGGWLGLEELTLGGREVGPGLLSVRRLNELRHLRLRCCRLREMQVLRSLITVRELRRLEFCEVLFHGHETIAEAREEAREEGVDTSVYGGDEDADKLDENDPVPNLRRSLAALLPRCAIVFTNCSVAAIETR